MNFQKVPLLTENKQHRCFVYTFAVWYILLTFPAAAQNSKEYEKQGMFTSKPDSALVGHLIKTLMVQSFIDCLAGCIEEVKCLSVNYASPGNNEQTFSCELNGAHSTGNHTNSLIRRLGSTHYSLHKANLPYKPSPCHNGGTWVENTTDIVNSFCNCSVPYFGIYCEEFRPSNCQHIQANGTRQDGEFELHLKWPEDKGTAKIYCAKMDSEKPLEYITLPAGKKNNYVHYSNHQTKVKEETHFEKLRIMVENMEIVLNDYTYASTNVPGVYHKFASAGDCVSSSCHASSRIGEFKVDLSATKFRMVEPIGYRFSNYPACTAKVFNAVMGEFHQRWSGKCGGYCGVCTPAAIYLETFE